MHISKAEREKFDVKVIKCSLVGYCDDKKAFRLLDHVTGKVIISRDVLFHEKPTLAEHLKPNPYVPLREEEEKLPTTLRKEDFTEIADIQEFIPKKSTRITKKTRPSHQ